MRKTIITTLGSALLVTATVQFAAAAHRHHGKTERTVITQKQTRNADAYCFLYPLRGLAYCIAALNWGNKAPCSRSILKFFRLVGAHVGPSIS